MIIRGGRGKKQVNNRRLNLQMDAKTLCRKQFGTVFGVILHFKQANPVKDDTKWIWILVLRYRSSVIGLTDDCEHGY